LLDTEKGFAIKEPDPVNTIAFEEVGRISEVKEFLVSGR
jgi:hypothetical protein